MSWRADDEALLRRLEDEALVEVLFVWFTSAKASREAASRAGERDALAPRVGGLVEALRARPGGDEAVTAALGGDIAALGRWVEALDVRECSPELVHHLALFHAKVAVALERSALETAAFAWVHALAAWFVLAEERSYLTRLEAAVLGDTPASRAPDVSIPSDRVPLELLAILARRAEATARELAPPGQVALLALARTDEAARIARASEATAAHARAFAERHRNAVVEAALAVVGEGLDAANARGDLSASGRDLLLRAVAVWTWTSLDPAVEHFVVDWIEKIGWEHYRARRWDALRRLLDPFRSMFESLAVRIERDRSELAYAAGCAQMFVFLAEVDRDLSQKIDFAERAVRVCPTHRNGRLVLASVLCEDAMTAMRGMVVFARRDEIARVEALVDRAEALYPQTRELPEARGMLERVKRGPIVI